MEKMRARVFRAHGGRETFHKWMVHACSVVVHNNMQMARRRMEVRGSGAGRRVRAFACEYSGWLITGLEDGAYVRRRICTGISWNT